MVQGRGSHVPHDAPLRMGVTSLLLLLLGCCSPSASAHPQLKTAGELLQLAGPLLPSADPAAGLALRRAGPDAFSYTQSLQENRRWQQQQPWSQSGATRVLPDYSADYAPSYWGAAPGKRQSFGAWAGKRDGLPTSHSNLVLRLQSFLKDKILHRDLSNKRQQFSAWAGKRSSAETDGDEIQEVTEQNTTAQTELGDGEALSKRRSGSSDQMEAVDLRQILNSIRDANVARRAFSAWSGKRGFSAWAGKRAELTN